MRNPRMTQQSMFCQQSNHRISDELIRIADVLGKHDEFVNWVHEDLTSGTQRSTGAKGMTSDQVLRAAILKQMNDWTYRFLELQCVDSEMTRAFLRLDFDESYSDSTLQDNISKITACTWIKINDALVRYAANTGIDKGRTVRMDATVVEANIHHPTDSNRLFDCLRLANDLLKKIRTKTREKVYGSIGTKTAKKAMLAVLDAKSGEERKAPYQILTTEAKKMVTILKRNLDLAESLRPSEKSRYDWLIEVTPIVINQAYQRVFKGVAVPSDQKIVSIFEPHTDIIVKGRREVEFGHKIFITAGVSGIVSDCQIMDGNPADSEYFLDLVERQQEIYGRVPRQTTADGGFSSEDNVIDAKALGVSDVCFSKSPGISIEDMVKSPWVFQKLRNLRAGVEGVISTLKRAFGLDRVPWKGSMGFARYVHSAIVSYNLALIGRLSK